MKRILLIISFIAATLFVWSQSTWEKPIIDVPGENVVRSIVEYKNGYIVCAMGYETDIGDGWLAIRLYRTDSVGNVLWQKYLGQIGYGYFPGRKGFLRLDDGSFILAGNIIDSAQTESKMLLAKFDSQMDTVWTKQYDQYHSRANTVRQTEDGGYALFGKKGPTVSTKDMYLLKTDSAGNFQWDKSYGDPGYFEDGRRLEVTDDGGFILGGQSGANNQDQADGYFMKTDSAGNVEWERAYGTQGDDGIRNITKSKNGGYIVWGGADTLTANTGYRWTSSIAKLDEAGNVVWRKFFSRPNRQTIWQLRELPDGSIVFIGRSENSEITEANNVGWIGKLSAKGNLLWERFYAYQENLDIFEKEADFGGDVRRTDDGGFIVAGSIWRQRDTTQPSINTEHIWLVKLDSMGCLQGDCGIEVGVNDKPTQKVSEATTVIYPNPFTLSALVSIRANGHPHEDVTFRLYSATGQLVRQTTEPLNSVGYTEWRLQRKHLSRGVYLYNVTQDGNVIGRGKVVVQ